jgi:hypothetical protein
MLLLYCKNDATLGWIVAGWHNPDATVDKSVYGTGIRVIPYFDSLGTLTRIGPAPALPAMDDRPYAMPDPTPQLLLAYAGQLRYEYVTGGIVYNSNSFRTDRDSQMLIGNLAYYASSIAPTDPIDFTQGSVHYALTAQDIINVNTQINALVQKYRSVEATCIVDLNSPTPTLLTYDDVDATFAAA